MVMGESPLEGVRRRFEREAASFDAIYHFGHPGGIDARRGAEAGEPDSPTFVGTVAGVGAKE